MRRFVIWTIGMWQIAAFAQDVRDTVRLQEAVIWGQSAQAFAHGSRLIPIQSNFQNLSLSDQLQLNTAVHFKTYGNGQLATITMRGLSASQTAVLWNGIPVNSPTLGQSDFSIWPVFFSDRIAIQKGSASALYGSDAIGGAVILDNTTFQPDSLLAMGVEIGSFGWSQYQTKFLVNHERFSAQTKLLYNYLENDFTYEFPGSDERRVQRNAAVQNYGFDQKFGWELGEHSFILNAAFVQSWRQIQPTITSTSEDELSSRLFRSSLMHNMVLGEVAIHNAFGWTTDQTVFKSIFGIANDSIPNQGAKTESQVFTLTNQGTLTLQNWSFRVGHVSQFIQANSQNFRADLTDWRVDMNGSIAFEKNRFASSINLKQHVSENHQVISPSLGAQFLVMDRSFLRLRHQLQTSSGFRLPTLNDKFWIPGGNTNLKPERSWSVETGQTLEFGRDIRHNLTWDVFHSWVENWIIWLPTGEGLYEPQNIYEVRSKGIEVGYGTRYALGRSTFSIDCNYAYVRSTEESGTIAEKGNQLPYTPQHQGQGTFGWKFDAFRVGLACRYTGLRYTTLNNTEFNSVEDFFLTDIMISRDWNMMNSHFQVEFGIYNSMDVTYQNFINHAMPGRNFKLRLTSKI